MCLIYNRLECDFKRADLHVACRFNIVPIPLRFHLLSGQCSDHSSRACKDLATFRLFIVTKVKPEDLWKRNVFSFDEPRNKFDLDYPTYPCIARSFQERDFESSNKESCCFSTKIETLRVVIKLCGIGKCQQYINIMKNTGFPRHNIG
eukprot:sb/3473708/